MFIKDIFSEVKLVLEDYVIRDLQLSFPRKIDTLCSPTNYRTPRRILRISRRDPKIPGDT